MFFLSRSHTISNTHILPLGSTPYRKRHKTRTIVCITPLQSILEEGLHSRQYIYIYIYIFFFSRLNDQFDASTRKTPQRRTLQINNKCSKQILIIIIIRNSCPGASMTMFHPTSIICGDCCDTCVSFFNLRHPRDFT